METDYVSRQWLLTEYDKRHKGPPGGARKMIEEAPPADVWPLQVGENITENNPVDEFVCSKCGIIIEDWSMVEIDEDDGERTNHEYAFRYCPNCGKPMK